MTISSSHYHSETDGERDRRCRSDIYRKLAPVYDLIMVNVDYPDWTDYIYSIIRYHHPHAEKVLELACGTGTMALEMEKEYRFRITATDISEEMIEIARKKGREKRSRVTWLNRDMRDIRMNNKFDVIFMVFDSLNYLQHENDILAVIQSAREHLERNGIFIFDFTTPGYSPKIAPLLNGEYDITEEYSYRRISRYDEGRRIHTNHFTVEKKDPDTGQTIDVFEETHLQKIWTLQEITEVVSRSPLQLIAAYEDFDLSAAGNKSERITMVLGHG